jgi:hypothetical protein
MKAPECNWPECKFLATHKAIDCDGEHPVCDIHANLSKEYGNDVIPINEWNKMQEDGMPTYDEILAEARKLKSALEEISKMTYSDFIEDASERALEVLRESKWI